MLIYSRIEFFASCFTSDLILAYLDGFSHVVLAIETHIVDGVLLLHPIIHDNNLKQTKYYIEKSLKPQKYRQHPDSKYN